MYKNVFAAIAVALMVNACESFGPIHIDSNGSEDSSQDQKPDDSGSKTPSQEGSAAVADGYKLLWQDLFDGTSLDTSVWNVEVNGDGGGNAELQFYRAENVTVGKDQESGRNCLILTAKRETYGNKAFTSGRINSKSKKAFTYGKVEALIKLPKTANGLWPAFWMMGNNFDQVGWPRCGEIDILEMGNSGGISAGTQDRFFNGACHWGFYKDVGGGNWAYPNYAKNSTCSYSLQDGEYHLFTLIWDASAVKMYVDYDKNPGASPYYEMGIVSKDDDWGTGHYFHHDFFILFNLAVGGYFTGILNSSAITALPAAGSEASMYVDYVKVYTK